MEEKKKDSIYKLGGTVPLRKALLLGIQHIPVTFLESVSPLTIVCGISEVSGALEVILIQNTTFVAGTVILFQLYPFWKIRNGLPVVMGTSSDFIGAAKAVGAAFDYGVLMGVSFVDDTSEMVMRYFVRPLHRPFPSVVTNLVIISIGPSLLPVGISYLGGGNSAADFRSTDHLLVGTFVIIIILIAKQFKGTINSTSVLIGIVAGCIPTTILGMVGFVQVSSTNQFTLPAFIPVAFEFNSQAIIAAGVMFIITAVGMIEDVPGVVDGRLNRETTDRELQGGVMANGLGSILGATFGVLSNASLLQNVDPVAVTRVVNHLVTMTGAVFLILYGFCPKLSVLLSVIPQSVLGGAAVTMFIMILVNGIQSPTREPLDERNGLIAALAISLGVGIGNVPVVLAQLPSWVENIFVQNGIIITFAITIVLNLILPKKKSEKEQYEDSPD